MIEKKIEKTESKQSIYERLSKIDVSSYLKPIKNKNFTLNYLSWANAWGLVKAIYPDATYKIKEYPNWQQLPDGTFQQVGTLDYRITAVGCEVEVTVNIEGNEYTQKLYPMDYKNNPIMKPSIKDINKAQMRCLVKALATAGLGLNVYAGDDLPTNEGETAKKPDKVTPISRSKSRNTAKPNFKTLTEAQLKNYTVEYHQDGDPNSDPVEFKIPTIYTFALQGDKIAMEWFEDMKTDDKLKTKDGQAVAQFRSSRYAAELRQAFKGKTKEAKEA